MAWNIVWVDDDHGEPNYVLNTLVERLKVFFGQQGFPLREIKLLERITPTAESQLPNPPGKEQNTLALVPSVEVFERLEDHWTNFVDTVDIFLVDLNLGGELSGIDLAKRILSERCDPSRTFPYVILVTGNLVHFSDYVDYFFGVVDKGGRDAWGELEGQLNLLCAHRSTPAITHFLLAQLGTRSHGIVHQYFGNCPVGLVSVGWTLRQPAFCKDPQHCQVKDFEEVTLPGLSLRVLRNKRTDMSQSPWEWSGRLCNQCQSAVLSFASGVPANASLEDARAEFLDLTLRGNSLDESMSLELKAYFLAPLISSIIATPSAVGKATSERAALTPQTFVTGLNQIASDSQLLLKHRTKIKENVAILLKSIIGMMNADQDFGSLWMGIAEPTRTSPVDFCGLSDSLDPYNSHAERYYRTAVAWLFRFIRCASPGWDRSIKHTVVSTIGSAGNVRYFLRLRIPGRQRAVLAMPQAGIRLPKVGTLPRPGGVSQYGLWRENGEPLFLPGVQILVHEEVRYYYFRREVLAGEVGSQHRPVPPDLEALVRADQLHSS